MIRTRSTYSSSFSFFFQAEDGIRDYKVTGVQTCALPISLAERPAARVLDIGCNDGTLLRAFPSGFVRFGIDPSDVAAEVGGEITVVQDLFPSAEQIGRAHV